MSAASTGARPPIHLIDREADAIGSLALQVEDRLPVVSAMLLTEIERAEIHDDDSLPEGVVSLGSEVDFFDEGSDQQRTVTLVLPGEADIAQGRVSILTPMGAGLFGLSTGQSIDWPDLEGRERRVRILAVRRPASPYPAPKEAA